jgi:hypothetical protein
MGCCRSKNNNESKAVASDAVRLAREVKPITDTPGYGGAGFQRTLAITEAFTFGIIGSRAPCLDPYRPEESPERPQEESPEESPEGSPCKEGDEACCDDDCLIFAHGGPIRQHDDINDNNKGYESYGEKQGSRTPEGKVKAKVQVDDLSCYEDKGYAKITVIFSTMNSDGTCDAAAEREIAQAQVEYGKDLDKTVDGAGPFRYYGSKCNSETAEEKPPPKLTITKGAGGCSELTWEWKCKIHCDGKDCGRDGELGIQYNLRGLGPPEVLWIKWKVANEGCCSLVDCTAEILLAETASDRYKPYYGEHYKLDSDTFTFVKQDKDPSKCPDKLCKED